MSNARNLADLMGTNTLVPQSKVNLSLTSADMPSGSVIDFKSAVTQGSSTATNITANSVPAIQYGANTSGRTYGLAQTITITPKSTSSILYCISSTGWTSAPPHSTGAHGSIITLDDTSCIDNNDYPWYSESYLSASNVYWPNDPVIGSFSPSTTSQVTIRLRPYLYRESGTKTMGYKSSSLIVMEIAG